MTGSDLNSSSKSWDDQENTTAIIYEEFYEQVPDIFMANNVLYLVLKNMVFDNHRKCLIQYYKKCDILCDFQTLWNSRFHHQSPIIFMNTDY